MPRDALWLDLHRVDVWELLALPTRWHSSSGAKPARKFSMRESGTAARDCKQAEGKPFRHGRTLMACTSRTPERERRDWRERRDTRKYDLRVAPVTGLGH